MTRLILPRSARPAYQCLVPGCGESFFSDEVAKFTKHVGRCAKRNRSALEELSAQRPFAGTPFGEAIDPEAAEYMRREKAKLRGE